MPEFIDREIDGAFGHAANWYMQGPFASGAPELGYQLSFVRSSWGNHAAAVTRDEVGRVRKTLAIQKTAQ